MTVPTITLQETPPDAEPAVAARRGYLRDVLGRFHGRPGTDDDVDEFLAEFGTDEGLAAPRGLFLVASDDDGTLLGCVGLRWHGPDVPADAAEVKRMWTTPVARGTGVGKLLLAEVTRRAREAGRARLVLDTRADLMEARTLYERAGFVETESYNENRHAQVWYALDLS